MIDYETIYSWVKGLPIVDWHNHLDMKTLAEDKPLGSLYEVWVKADPYKHRAMRICGEAERVITGDAGEDEKWAAWMRTLPKLVGNPLFAWAKMEMEWLGIGEKSHAETQRRGGGEWIRGLKNVSLAEWTPSKMLRKFGVEYLRPCVGAGDIENVELWNCGNMKLWKYENGNSAIALSHNSIISQSNNIAPSLRMSADEEVSVEALEKFHAAGCRVVDVSVDDVSDLPDAARWGQRALPTVAAFAAAHGWTMLLHLGALRETSARLRTAAGPAGGFAGMRSPVDPAAVAAFLNALESMPNGFSHKEHKAYTGIFIPLN